jgi:enoyl-CoA hydratase/carnithine racemase
VRTDANDRQIRLERMSPSYWRATLDLPPLNIFGPDSIPQLEAIVGSLERDPHVKVVVFDSAVEGFFLTHCDFLADLEESTSLPPGPTGLPPLPDMLVRLSRAPVVSIASIRGRATGVGSELALACEPRNGSSMQRACRPKPTSLRSGMHSSIPYSVPPPRPGSRR